MSSEISTGGVEASEILIGVQPFVVFCGPGIRVVAKLVEIEVIWKAEFVADIG